MVFKKKLPKILVSFVSGVILFVLVRAVSSGSAYGSLAMLLGLDLCRMPSC